MKVNSVVVVSIVCIAFSLRAQQNACMAAKFTRSSFFGIKTEVMSKGNYAPTDHYLTV